MVEKRINGVGTGIKWPIRVGVESPGVIWMKRGRVGCLLSVFRPSVSKSVYSVDGERVLTEILHVDVNCVERCIHRMKFLGGCGDGG